ncbi:MAG: hypothetical protein JKY53_00350 [Flavobacteriales bacterium]|nr:hypothetical protein [Flavobacteriales bacterium]
MNKVYTLAVMLIATAFFSLQSADVSAQCENAVKGSFYPMIGTQNNMGKQQGQLMIAKYQNTENSSFPYYVEWRKGSVEGEIIKSGVIAKNSSEAPKENDSRILKNLEADTYYLISYDNSTPCKKVVTEIVIK